MAPGGGALAARLGPPPAAPILAWSWQPPPQESRLYKTKPSAGVNCLNLTLRRIAWLLAAVALIASIAWPAQAFMRDTYGHWAAPIVTRFAIRTALPADEPFRPDAPVTRAELANLLVLAADLGGQAAELNGINPAFVDVSASHPLARYAQVAYEQRWLIGDGSRLEPDRPITRAELAVVLSRIYGLTEAGTDDAAAGQTAAGTDSAATTVFRDDADIPDWARAAVAAAVAHGLVNGFPDGTFRPHETATRAQAVTLLQAMLFRRSDAFTVIGPVDGYDGPTRTITIAGQPWQFAQGALLLRGDAFISPFQLPPTDLLRAVADKNGRLVYAESVPLEDLAVLASTGPDPGTLTVTPLGFIDWQHWLSKQAAPRAGRVGLELAPDAIVYRNGQRATLRDLLPGDRLYVRRDARDGTVIAIDAVQVDANGYIDAIAPLDPAGALPAPNGTVGNAPGSQGAPGNGREHTGREHTGHAADTARAPGTTPEPGAAAAPPGAGQRGPEAVHEQLAPAPGAAPSGPYELKLVSAKGQPITATITAESIVYIDGARANASELRPGDRVIVHVGPAAGGAPAPVKYMEATR